ncbi:hypothetical protein Poli38472_004089 [Pythium oligandrum]|uniref:RRM domain-containing protein n=1 Tax=Pythium oligandrum TaxID=41045 RepID=A0A8K1CMP5_PYTOL|nr:hypothetical protein Poli38472_004089 [Pythium oligandrum]|eukprot:TMW66324.1 hypothetical protein Poli38472_004089 [Pythium oligandrum]
MRLEMETGDADVARIKSRHKPRHASNALVDYVEQSLAVRGRVEQEERHKPRRRRRKKPTKTPDPEALDTVKRVIVRNLVTPDELDDSDEYGDVVEDLRSEFERFGPFMAFDLDRSTGELVMAFESEEQADEVVKAKHGHVYGGKALIAEHAVAIPSLHGVDDSPTKTVTPTVSHNEPVESKQKKKRKSKIKSAVLARRQQHNVPLAPDTRLVVRDLVDPGEVEEEDEYEELVEELTSDFARFGRLESFIVIREPDDQALCSGLPVGSVVVHYEAFQAAQAAFAAYNGKTFGNRVVTSSWLPIPNNTLHVHGMVEPDEVVDEDEFEDVRDEVRAFFTKLEGVQDVELSQRTGDVVIHFIDPEYAMLAQEKLETIRYGGKDLIVKPELGSVSGQQDTPRMVKSNTAFGQLQSTQTEHMSSLIISLLQRLSSLQERAHIQNPLQDKRSRRLVLGLHEVRRGVISRKICLIIVGTDVEACQLLDETFGEILQLALKQDIPVICSLTRCAIDCYH